MERDLRRRLTFDMLRSFVTLAETLNVSLAAQATHVTRQTLRRNLSDLEALRGVALFRLDGLRYVLTPEGEACLHEARTILAWGEAWDSRSRRSVRLVQGFEHAAYHGADGRRFYAQQHSLGTLAQDGLPLLRRAFAAWGQSLARLDTPEMDALRPYMVIFRRTGESWTFAEVGEKSAYARWFGLAYARSAMGTRYDADDAGDAFNAFIARAYREVHDGGSIRLDHLHAQLPRGGAEYYPVSFQRLLAGCVLPDGSQALAMLAALTNRVRIDALRGRALPRMAAHLVMDADLAGPDSDAGSKT